MSFWWFEVEILQQGHKEEKRLLTGKRFAKARAFSCNIRQFELVIDSFTLTFVSDVAVFVMKSDVKLQLTHSSPSL